MGTKSNRSAGSQFTPNGPVQGDVLVDPNTGQPISVTTGIDGKHRLAVDANITADEVIVDTRPLVASTDAVRIEDPTTGAHIKVNLDGSIDADIAISASTDNIAIADAGSGNKMTVNADGSINVNIVTSNSGTYLNNYNEVTSVASGILTTVATYTVPVGKSAFLQKVVTSGTNIAEYSVLKNVTTQEKGRTYFGNSLNLDFDFSATDELGIPLIAGDVVAVKVIHNRPSLGDFNARIQVVEQ